MLLGIPSIVLIARTVLPANGILPLIGKCDGRVGESGVLTLSRCCDNVPRSLASGERGDRNHSGGEISIRGTDATA